jgi:hypothetical protein
MRFAIPWRVLVVLPLLLPSFAVAQQFPVPLGQAGGDRIDARLPAWIKPGVRISYYQGAATIPSSGQTLVPDDNGNWVNSNTGQKYSAQDALGAGGSGITQMTVMAADERTLAVETRMFLLMDPAGGRVSASDTGAIVGTPGGLGENWVPPAKLAAIREIREGAVTITRMPYRLGGKDFKAIVVQTRTAGGFTRYTYDLDSGLLLCLSTSSVGGAVLTPNPNGTAGRAAGDTMITSTILLGVRQLNLPWLNDGLPAFAQRGRQINYAGSTAIVVPGCPVFPQESGVSFDLGDAGAGWIRGRMTTRQTLPGAPAQERVFDRALGAATSRPSWIKPQSLAGLKPGQVIDEDPITKFRTTFGGVQGNAAVLIEEGPFDRSQCAYDLNTGLMTEFVSQQQNGVGQVQTRLRVIER